MSFEKTFCSSPWFHMRINNSGHYEYCRWADTPQRTSGPDIGTVAPRDFFQQHMSQIRQQMIDGVNIPECHSCCKMEEHGKISGRQKQLLKTGISTENFVKTIKSSPWFDKFSCHQTDLLPQDWQIDLGNYCNSGCVFCGPESSSKLAAEFKKLNIKSSAPATNWCHDDSKLKSFLDALAQTPNLRYLHFIGGETLITPAFKTILKALVQYSLNRQVTIGFTTNLNCWDQETIDLLQQFEHVNLGVSIECFHPVNDYVRWPSNISSVVDILNQWLNVAHQQKWLIQIRTTPTFLTVGKLLTIYDFAWQNNVSVESCNFLSNPEFLKISVLPVEYRLQIISDIKSWIATRSVSNKLVVNIRNPEFSKTQITQDLNSYVDYLENSADESHLLPGAVSYLKLLESNRKNSILNYLPEYEELFRSAGY